MKKILMAAAVAVLTCAGIAGMAACGNSGGKKMSAADAAAMIAGFTKTPDTVSGTWSQKYDLHVTSDNATFTAFEAHKDSVTTFDIDLSNAYMYAKKASTDTTAKTTETTEYIVAQEGTSYYYATTKTAKTALKDKAAALEQINTLFQEATKETSGWLDTGAFTYSKDWMQNYILLGSPSASADGKDYTYNYSRTKDEGLSVKATGKTIGYTGDSGVIEVESNDKYTGSEIEVTTDKDGFVLSMSQKLNNYLDFPLSTPPIPLDYTGTRTLAASYNGTVTQKKISDVNASETKAEDATITVYPSTGCTVQTYNFDPSNIAASVKEESTTVTPGNYVAVKVTPADSTKEVSVVLVNGAAAENKNGYYTLMTPAKSGETYNVAVTLKDKDAGASETASIIVSGNENCTVTGHDFDPKTYAGLNTASTTVTAGNYVALEVACEDGYTVKSVTVNGEATVVQGGKYYCYMTAPAVAGAEYNVDVTLAGVGKIVVNPCENCTIETYDFNFSAFTGLDKQSTTVTEGNFVAVSVTPAEGYQVASVTINDTTAILQGGFYVVIPQTIVAGQTYTVTVTVTPVAA